MIISLKRMLKKLMIQKPPKKLINLRIVKRNQRSVIKNQRKNQSSQKNRFLSQT